MFFPITVQQDYVLIEKAMDVLEGKAKKVDINMICTNEDRTLGATLSYEVSKLVRTFFLSTV